MKKHYKLFILLIIFGLFAACSSEKVGEDAKITIITSEFTVVAEQGSKATATFSINVDWATSTVSYDGDVKDWLTLAPISGKLGTNKTITMEASANLAEVDREASFTIKYGVNKEHKITVTQQGTNPAIVISTSEFTVVAEQGSKATATFSINVDWETTVISYEGDVKDWLTMTPISGIAGTDQTITMEASANLAEVERKASFAIKYGDLKEHKLTVTQLGTTPAIIISTSEFTVVGEEASEAIATFSINVGWETIISYDGDIKDWLTVTPSKGGAGIDQTITMKASANPTVSPRKAYVTIKYGVNKEHKITVTQQGINPVIDISTSEFTIGGKQDSETIATFSINVGWTASSISYVGDVKDWLTITPTSGIAGAGQSITMKAAANPAMATREAFFTINYGEGKEHKLTVTQSINGDVDITAHFDVLFAAKLQEKSYIPNATKILLSDVMNIDRVIISGTIATLGELTSLAGIEYLRALTTLNCSYNKITALDLSPNTALKRLDCYGNLLKTLDMSKNIALVKLNCYGNLLETLDLGEITAVGDLMCFNNQLTTLDVSKNTGLKILMCGNNQLTTLDVSKNTMLMWVNCAKNQLTVLDMSKNTALTEFNCENNQLTAIDVSNNKKMYYFGCNFNKLTALDVSENKELGKLECIDNMLPYLDISKNTTLTNMDCHNNPGDGVIFVVKIWFDITTKPIPEYFTSKDSSWLYNDATITIDYQQEI